MPSQHRSDLNINGLRRKKFYVDVARTLRPGLTSRIRKQTSKLLAAMAIGGGGTSREYLLDRLERAGRTDLLDGIARGQITVLMAAEAAGFYRRPIPTGRGSPNGTKRRRFAL